jgi:segregation and condensation protein A
MTSLIPVGPGVAQAEPGEPSVRFGEGRRPEAATHVHLESFDGPLGLLLSLIEARQLDVLTVPLGALATAYLEALASLDADRLPHISSFVTIASQLILIKSRALLPRQPDPAAVALDDEPDPEAELRARLLLYRAYRDGGAALQDDPRAAFGLFHRDAPVARAAGVAGAVAPVGTPDDPRLLVAALDGLARIAPPPEPPPEVVRRAITIHERAAILRAALREAGEVVLQDLLRGVRDRVLVAVTFLALLELVKRREVEVEQAEPWGPIIARRAAAREAEA